MRKREGESARGYRTCSGRTPPLPVGLLPSITSWSRTTLRGRVSATLPFLKAQFQRGEPHVLLGVVSRGVAARGVPVLPLLLCEEGLGVFFVVCLVYFPSFVPCCFPLFVVVVFSRDYSFVVPSLQLLSFLVLIFEGAHSKKNMLKCGPIRMREATRGRALGRETERERERESVCV